MLVDSSASLIDSMYKKCFVFGVVGLKMFGKYCLVILTIFAFVGCEKEKEVAVNNNSWQEEIFLQVDELRQKQIALEKEVVSLKAQLAEYSGQVFLYQTLRLFL